MQPKTQEELKTLFSQLSAQHKPIYTIEIPLAEDEAEFRTIYLKKYDRALLSAVQKLVSAGSDSLKAIEVFVKNTYVGGDDLNEILNNLDMLRSLEGVVVELMQTKTATIKKN
jgi:hypothetical protein